MCRRQTASSCSSPRSSHHAKSSKREPACGKLEVDDPHVAGMIGDVVGSAGVAVDQVEPDSDVGQGDVGERDNTSSTRRATSTRIARCSITDKRSEVRSCCASVVQPTTSDRTAFAELDDGVSSPDGRTPRVERVDAVEHVEETRNVALAHLRVGRIALVDVRLNERSATRRATENLRHADRADPRVVGQWPLHERA